MTAATGAPATTKTPAPAAVTAASAPLRLATTLLRWTSEEAMPGSCPMGCHVSNRRGSPATPSAAGQPQGLQLPASKAIVARRPWPLGCKVRSGTAVIRRGTMYQTRSHQQGAVLLGVAGGMLVVAGGLAAGDFIFGTRSEAQAATTIAREPA